MRRSLGPIECDLALFKVDQQASRYHATKTDKAYYVVGDPGTPKESSVSERRGGIQAFSYAVLLLSDWPSTPVAHLYLTWAG